MDREHTRDKEYSGLLVRDASGFILQCDNGKRYRLELLRIPVDEVEKRVVVTGRVFNETSIEAEGVRLA